MAPDTLGHNVAMATIAGCVFYATLVAIEWAVGRGRRK
jgi:hypothetical protein